MCRGAWGVLQHLFIIYLSPAELIRLSLHESGYEGMYRVAGILAIGPFSVRVVCPGSPGLLEPRRGQYIHTGDSSHFILHIGEQVYRAAMKPAWPFGGNLLCFIAAYLHFG